LDTANPLQVKSLRNNLLEAVATAIQSTQTNVVSVALSGGLDSMVLLHLCAILMKSKASSLTQPVQAIHINHGISDKAHAWQQFCRKQCEQRGIAFFCKSSAIQKRKQVSLEADARKIRYALIQQYSDECVTSESCASKLTSASDTSTAHSVLLAQHQDDQAETFLLQLQRGAGTKGLASMGVQTQTNEGLVYLRPLLNFTRQQLAEFAEHEHLEWVEDESNTDEQFSRNFLRHQVIPLLQSRWPQINKTIARSAQHCGNAEIVIEEYMQQLAETVLSKPHVANLAALKELSLHTRTSFLRYWLSGYLREMPSQAQLQQILSLIDSNENTSAHVRLQSWCIENFQSALHLSPLTDQSLNNQSIQVDKLTPLNACWQIIPKQSTGIEHEDSVTTLKVPSLDIEVKYGASNLGARFSSKRPTKSMKVWFQEWGVSPMQRKQTPILVHKGRVLAVLLLNGQVMQSVDDSTTENTHLLSTLVLKFTDTVL